MEIVLLLLQFETVILPQKSLTINNKPTIDDDLQKCHKATCSIINDFWTIINIRVHK